MKYISLKEKIKGKIKKNKEYTLVNFVSICKQMVPKRISKPNKPFFTSKKSWKKQGEYAFRNGYNKCLIAVTALMEQEIDEDNINTTKKRGKKQ